ncbi:MAG: DNA polymerase IV [Phycisphaeraceae bacterium]|nr:DNA polymerase IV [Phycisphaeraceae bacterium]
MGAPRWILHLDMDAFFAAVEQRDKPALRGLPVLIGHDGPRGVVATASYEARPYGCHSAQPMSIAKRRCPQAVVLPVDGQRYREVSQQMFAILDEFSPVVEPLSIDEAFLDLTGTQRSLGEPAEVARRLKDRIQSELKLTASIGLAPNKFLAKMGSDMNKPDGLVIINPQDIDRVLLPLPVSRLWGIGRVSAAHLEEMGIRTVGDLRQLSIERLQRYFGSDAERYYNLSRGIDERPVVPDQEAKSIGHEQTFPADLGDADDVRRVLFDQVQQVAYRLRKHGMMAKGVSVKIRFGDFQTISRSTTLHAATDLTTELWQAAREMFDRWPFQPVRLIGVTAERLNTGGESLELFPDPDRARQRKLDQLADHINEKFGKQTIRRGGADRTHGQR